MLTAEEHERHKAHEEKIKSTLLWESKVRHSLPNSFFNK